MGRKKNRSKWNRSDWKRAGELAARAETLSSHVLPVTSGIYQAADSDQPELVGSGVLVALGDARFLFTARHVLDQRHIAPLVAGVSPDLISVSGDVTTLRANTATSDDEDYIDVGIVRLEGGPWSTIPATSFASWRQLDIAPPIVAQHTFGLIGFPHSKNRRPVEGDRIIGIAYRMAGLECTADVYSETGTNPVTNVLVGFDHKTMLGPDGPRTAPDMYGASGCGLWRFGRRIREANEPARLSGIAIEWRKKTRHKHVLGTRLQVIVAALVEKYSDVADFVKNQFEAVA